MHPRQGAKYDKDKPLFDLLPPVGIAHVAHVLTYGAKKYAPENWRKVVGWRWRYLGAALRHLFAYMNGDRVDPESGMLHLAHAACCLLFMIELDMNTPQVPDGDERGDKT
jgi:hypothetical protein